jgi:FkbM family methyltransferase
VRPLLLQLLPQRLRLAAWARLYRPRPHRRLSLYPAAQLAFAPRVRMELVPGDLVSDGIAYTGIHELHLSRRLVRLARRGGTLLDVGANLGYFALLWVAARAGNRCIAVEPAPRNVELLRRNVERNGFQASVQVVAAAAAREAGTMAFDPGPADQTGWGGLVVGPGKGPSVVQTVRLDDVAGHLPSVDLLKVDAEGADTWVLLGADRLLREHRVAEIWFEQNKPRMRALGIEDAELQRYLRGIGYDPRPDGDPAADVVPWSARPRR